MGIKKNTDLIGIWWGLNELTLLKHRSAWPIVNIPGMLSFNIGSILQKRRQKKKRGSDINSLSRTLIFTYNTERFSGKSQSSLPSSITTTATRRPDSNDELQTKDDNHHELLKYEIRHVRERCYRANHSEKLLGISGHSGTSSKV